MCEASGWGQGLRVTSGRSLLFHRITRMLLPWCAILVAESHLTWDDIALLLSWHVLCSFGYINTLKCPFRGDMKAMILNHKLFFYSVTKVKMKCTLCEALCREGRWGRVLPASGAWAKSTSKWSEIKCGRPKKRHWWIWETLAFIGAGCWTPYHCTPNQSENLISRDVEPHYCTPLFPQHTLFFVLQTLSDYT